MNLQLADYNAVQGTFWPSASQSIVLPYSGKFSRGPIFAVFAVNCQSMKIKPSK